MKYELIGKNNLLNPIETILHNRGIEDVKSFLNVNEQHVIHWSKLKNIDKAVDCLLKHIKNKSNIYVPIDPDCDGFCSCAILINYLTKIFPDVQIQWDVPEGKEHGVKLKQVPNDIQLVIIPDAGSNQFDEHKQLQERGIDVIVLDHHECSEESSYAIVVNSQISPDYPNKNLTGGGIVYKFCQGLDDRLGIKHADYYLDLVALANIGDMADSRELETRYYMLKGLKQINNSFFKALCKKQDFSLKGIVNIIGVQFYIVPLINGAVRAGTIEDKINMMKAFLESTETLYYEKKDEYQPIQTFMARTLYNLKNQQNRNRDKGVALIEERIEKRNLNENKILIVNVTDVLDKNLTGLVATRLTKAYKRPVLLLRQSENNMFKGSIRGFEKGAIKDFKQFLIDTDKFEFVEGHANAAGFEINGNEIVELNELINEQLKDVEINVDIYDVDFIITGKQLTESIIQDIYSLRDTWGQKVEEPVLAIKDISIDKDDIKIYIKTNTTIKFEYRGIEFVKFRSSEEKYNEVINKGQTLVLDVVGKVSINEYNGGKKPQIIMEDFEVVDIKETKQWIF